MNKPQKSKKRLGEMLVDAGIVDEYQLKSALSHQQQWGGRLGQNLVKLGLISEERLVAFLCKQFRLPAVDFRQIRVMPGVLKLIKPEVAEKYNILPLFVGEEDGKDFVAVVMSNPVDLQSQDEVEFATGKKVRPVVAADDQIAEAVAYYYFDRGAAPYAPDAKPSTEMTYGDLIKMTKQYLAMKAEAAGKSDVPDSMHPGERQVTFEEEDASAAPAGEDDQVIVFGAGGQKQFDLEDNAADSSKQSSGGRRNAPSNEEVLRALVNVLIDNGLITRDELLKRLNRSA